MTCFVDMDGVLADYYGGVCLAFGVEPWPYKCRHGDWDFFCGEPLGLTPDTVAPKMDAPFYAGLAVLPDAARIVRHAEALYGAANVYLLTAPWDTPGCFDGKLAWVKRHVPAYARRILCGSPKEACAHSGAVLYDDSPANCHKFVSAGGSAFLVPRPWNDLHAHASLDTGAVLGDRWAVPA